MSSHALPPPVQTKKKKKQQQQQQQPSQVASASTKKATVSSVNAKQTPAKQVIKQKTASKSVQPVKSVKAVKPVQAAKVVKKIKTSTASPQLSLKTVGPKTVRGLPGLTLFQLQKKKRLNSLFVINMLPNHNIMVEVSDGAFSIPDSWLPFDLSTRAEPSAYLKSLSFRALLSPTAKRGPLLKAIDADTAIQILESAAGQQELERLQTIERGVTPTTRAVNTNVIKADLKSLMKDLDSGKIKPRPAAAILANLITNEAEKAYVLRRSNNNTITTLVRNLKLTGSRATVKGDSTPD